MQDTPNTLYWQENGQLKYRNSTVDDCSKIDLHVHSKYSGIKPNLFIPHWMTRAIGVREAYGSPKKIKKLLKERGMDFFTLTDHDSILGALEFDLLCAEYKVTLDHRRDQKIEVIPVGINYAENRTKPIKNKKVLLDLHRELKNQGSKGILPMIDFCADYAIPLIWAHPAY